MYFASLERAHRIPILRLILIAQVQPHSLRLSSDPAADDCSEAEGGVTLSMEGKCALSDWLPVYSSV